MANYPQVRLRRLRGSAAARALFAPVRLHPHDFIAPLFVMEGKGKPVPIKSMPGQARLGAEAAAREALRLAGLGVRAVLLFGVTGRKDARGSSSADPLGPVPQAVKLIKKLSPKTLVFTDACLCEYTDHGHCGLLEGHEVLNDESLEPLADMALAHAEAGADFVAPSDMMDGRIGFLRKALDKAGHQKVGLMAYSAKYASAFYGPFRDAAGSSPSFGDRGSYQMQPASLRESLRELEQDAAEGADILMVKPAGPYLDVIAAARSRFGQPLAAYQVSGEYSMIHAAADKGYLDLTRARDESLLAIKRAGADLLISYFAGAFAADFKKRGGLLG